MKTLGDTLHLSKKSQTWTEYLAKVLTVTTIFVCVVGIILYSYDLYRHGRQKHYIGWFSSAGFVLLTIPISIRLIIKHLTHYNAPHIQKYVVRIIWMIPIYSIESWLALRFTSASIYIETVRECYEAYVIFCFFYFLIAVLGEEQTLILKLKQKSPDYGRHSWPISLFVSPWAMGNELLQKCKFGVFQYVIIKNLTAILVCILASRGQYAEGKFRFDGFYLYQCLICNASQLWALYCLVLFYFATKEELAPWRPVGKFLSVKTVVFFTWWQAIIINILAPPLNRTGVVSEEERHWTNNEVSKGLQNYVICIEMFVASIAFTYAFTHKDYQLGKEKAEEESKPFLSAFLQSSVPDDIFSDLRRYARSNGVVRKVLGTIGLDSAEGGHGAGDGDTSSDDEETALHPLGSAGSGGSSGGGVGLIVGATSTGVAGREGREGSVHSSSTHSAADLIPQVHVGSPQSPRGQKKGLSLTGMNTTATATATATTTAISTSTAAVKNSMSTSIGAVSTHKLEIETPAHTPPTQPLSSPPSQPQ